MSNFRWRDRGTRTMCDVLKTHYDDAYPNVNFRDCLLGTVGVFSNANYVFSPHTTLENLGIKNIKETKEPRTDRDVFTYDSDTSFSFRGGLGDIGTASIRFGGTGSVVFHALSLQSRHYDLVQLEAEVKQAIAAGLRWDPEWCIVTEVLFSDACKIFYSVARNARVDITTNVPIPGAEFDLSDLDLDVKYGFKAAKEHHGRAVNPFYYISKLKGWDARSRRSFASLDINRLRLDAYGRY